MSFFAYFLKFYFINAHKNLQKYLKRNIWIGTHKIFNVIKNKKCILDGFKKFQWFENI